MFEVRDSKTEHMAVADSCFTEDADFIAACDPQTILALCAMAAGTTLASFRPLLERALTDEVLQWALNDAINEGFPEMRNVLLTALLAALTEGR